MFGLFASVPFGLKVTLSLLGLLVFLIYRFFTKYFNYWKEQGVIFDKPVPIFGSVSSSILLKEHLTHYIQKLYHKHEGEPFVGYFQGRTPTFMPIDVGLIKRIFVKDFSHFVDHGFTIHEEADPLQAKNLFNLEGQKWKDMRTKLIPTFTSGKIKGMFPHMLECTEQFDEHLTKMAEGKEYFEAKDLLGCFFTDIIGSCIFGINTNTIKDPNNQFRLMGKRLIELNFVQVIKLIMVIFLPDVAYKFKIGVLEKDVTNFFRKLVKDVMEMRKKTNTVRRDFIQLLMELKEKGSIALEEDDDDKHLKNELQDANLNSNNLLHNLTDDDITAQATVFFLAGFETSSTLLSFILLELAANPDVQKKAQLELYEAMSQNNAVISYDTLKTMKYLDWIMQEALRKYPPVPNHSRKCTKKYVVPGTNVTLDEGVLVTIPSYALQNDPKFFPNPDRFEPERFSDDDALHKHQYIHSPFGEGPRQCIGNRFALVQSKLALLTILRKYNISQCSKTVYPAVFDPKQFILTAQDGIWLKIEKRSSE